MEGFNPNVFRAYDVRGVWGRDFDAAFAQRLASKIAAYWQAGVILVGRDNRVSSDELAHALMDGALHVGAKVIDVGHVSTPQLAWAVNSLGAIGGLMATASHNPGEYNGIKVIAKSKSGLEIIGGHHLRQIYDSHAHNHSQQGSLAIQGIIEPYAAAVAKAAGWHGQEIAVSIDAPIPVRQALASITRIAPDDIAAKFDSDGDRVVFYQDGKSVPADWIFLLLVESYGLDPVTFDLRFSRSVREHLTDWNIKSHESAVGRLAMTQKMKDTGSALGGEISGHFYWREFSDMECPELTLLKVARILPEKGKKLAELIAPYSRYSKSQEMNLPVRDQKMVASTLNHVAARYGKEHVSRVDGITVDLWDSEGWWFNLRPSNTEPVLRLMAEAKNKDLLQEKVLELRQSL